jgi:hypothetical protein
MMKATPASPLEVPEANSLFESVVVVLNAPVQLDDIDELTEANICGKALSCHPDPKAAPREASRIS